MLTAISGIRPNRITDPKDENYHNMWGRFGVGAYYNNPSHIYYLQNILRNEMFYQNKQWMFPEDIETFLEDESGETRNRLQITKNMIKPIVESYRGNGIRMDIGATARCISPTAVTRFEKSLETAQFYTEVARQVPKFAEAIKKGRPVGDNPQETEQIHENVYVDGFVEAINDLMEWVADLNELDSMPMLLAESLAFGGLATVFDYEYAGNQRFKHIPAKDFFWDRNARKNDLTDAQGMGICILFSFGQRFIEGTCGFVGQGGFGMVDGFLENLTLGQLRIAGVTGPLGLDANVNLVASFLEDHVAHGSVELE